ncbi:methyltransferase type 11 [Spirochaetia bacterium]|nr:methyltransferase type 11 [Spirochaetia bacterium]
MAVMKFFRQFKDLGISGPFTRWYDKNTREYRLAEMQGYAREVAGHLKDGANVLEVAPGPGYLSIELAKLGDYNITGMDISADFVEICKTNAKRENVNVTFVQGNVSAMPFEDSIFDFIVCSAAFKNFREPVMAIREMYRVLKNNGIALILDMNRNAPKEMIEAEAAKTSRPGFERWFMKTTFRYLCKSAYTKDEFEKIIKQTSFNKTDIKEMGIGLLVYTYK